MSQALLCSLPYMPLNEQWLAEHPLFLSGDARLVRACMRMMLRAWRSVPAGSLLPSFSALADVTGLTEREIQENYSDLTHGWELRDERLFHVELSDLCDRITRRHGEFLEQVAEDAATLIQGPEDFTLTLSAAEPSKNKGKRAFPKNFVPSQDTRRKLAVLGISTDEDVAHLVEVMSNWALSKGEKRSNWDATLMIFANSEAKANLPSFRSAIPLVGTSAPSRFGGLLAKGDAALRHNRSAFDRVREGQASASREHGG